MLLLVSSLARARAAPPLLQLHMGYELTIDIGDRERKRQLSLYEPSHEFIYNDDFRIYCYIYILLKARPDAFTILQYKQCLPSTPGRAHANAICPATATMPPIYGVCSVVIIYRRT